MTLLLDSRPNSRHQFPSDYLVELVATYTVIANLSDRVLPVEPPLE